jgi:hypothetical protein
MELILKKRALFTISDIGADRQGFAAELLFCFSLERPCRG